MALTVASLAGVRRPCRRFCSTILLHFLRALSQRQCPKAAAWPPHSERELRSLISILLWFAAGSAIGSASDAAKIVAGAREQLSWGTKYDPSYVRMKYPGGDVPKTKGVCTDVVIRAFRKAGFDLQKLIHEDKKMAPSAYPKYPGSRALDSNIDHRRVPNQMVFFKRHGLTLAKKVSPETLKDWKPGDVVCWKLDSGLDHIGIITDEKNMRGVPWVIHNLSTPQEEACLTDWKITGHFRYPK